MNIIQDSNIRRLLKTCSLEEADRVPNFEHFVMGRTTKYFLGEKRLNKIIKSEEMKHLLYLYSEEESRKNIEKKISKNRLRTEWRNEIISSGMLPPAENLKLTQAMGIDAAGPMITWLPKVRDLKPDISSYG